MREEAKELNITLRYLSEQEIAQKCIFACTVCVTSALCFGKTGFH